MTGISDDLPEPPSAALPKHEEDEPEPVKHEAEPVLTEDEENEAIAEDLASRLKNFRPQRINNILIIFLFKNLKLTLKNLSNIINARRSKNDDLPEEEKTGFKWKLNDGSEWELSKSDMEDLRPLYPAIDFEQELRKSIGWSLANPKYRKTKSGILKHINTWLTNAQNSATGSGNKNQAGRKSGYVARDAGVDFENVDYNY